MFADFSMVSIEYFLQARVNSGFDQAVAAWESRVIAAIRRPQKYGLYVQLATWRNRRESRRQGKPPSASRVFSMYSIEAKKATTVAIGLRFASCLPISFLALRPNGTSVVHPLRPNRPRKRQHSAIRCRWGEGFYSAETIASQRAAQVDIGQQVSHCMRHRVHITDWYE